MRTVLEHMESLYFILNDPSMDSHVQSILAQPAELEGDNIPPSVSSALVALWDHDGVQECFTKSIEHALSDPSV